MRAVVLAAGKGERLGRLTQTIPKPMLLVGKKPILQYSVEILAASGITEIFINLYYLPKVIVDYFGDGSRFGVKIIYSYEDRLLGTAGAVKKLEAKLNETFLVVYSDTLRKIDYQELIRAHKRNSCLVTVALYKANSFKDCGIIELDETGRIKRFLEKPKDYRGQSRLANAGVYCLEPKVLQFIPQEEKFDFAHDLFPKLLGNREKLGGFLLNEPVLDIGTPQDYKLAREMFG